MEDDGSHATRRDASTSGDDPAVELIQQTENLACSKAVRCAVTQIVAGLVHAQAPECVIPNAQELIEAASRPRTPKEGSKCNAYSFRYSAL